MVEEGDASEVCPSMPIKLLIAGVLKGICTINMGPVHAFASVSCACSVAEYPLKGGMPGVCMYSCVCVSCAWFFELCSAIFVHLLLHRL